MTNSGDHSPIVPTYPKRPVNVAAQTDGTADAMILRHWAEYNGALGVTIGLRPQRYELFRTFVMLHLIGRISFPFHGFAASPEDGLILPNEREFFGGRPYSYV
jgi:hypothetical protein